MEYIVGVEFSVADNGLISTLKEASALFKTFNKDFLELNNAISSFSSNSNKAFVELSKRIDASASRAANLSKELQAIGYIKIPEFGTGVGGGRARSNRASSVAEEATIYGMASRNFSGGSNQRAYSMAASSGYGMSVYGGGSGGMRDVYGFDETVGGNSSSGGGGRSGWNGRGYTGGRAFNFRNDMHGAMGSAFDGAMLAGAGYIGLKLVDKIANEAAKYQTISEQFNSYGMGANALSAAQAFAANTHIAGSSQTDILRDFTEAQGVFRESGKKSLAEQLEAAKMAAPQLAKMDFAMRGLDEKHAEITKAKQLDMLRFVEQAGGLKSASRFNELMDNGFKAIQSSGGNIDFTQYRQFMAKGGTAAMGLSNKAMFAEFEPIIGELKGGAAGDALMTSFNRLNGIVKLPNQVAHELTKYGIWDANKITWNNQGGIKQFNGNPFTQSAQFGSNPIEFYEKTMLPMYAKMKLDESQIQVENAKIFGRTGGKMFNLIDKQLTVIHHSADSFDQARGMNGAYDAVQKTYAGNKLQFDSALHNFMLALGKDGGVLTMATSALKFMTIEVEHLTNWAKANPTTVKVLTLAFIGLSTALLFSGSVMLLVGGFKALAAIFYFFPMAALSRLPVLLSLSGVAITTFGSALVSLMAVLAAAYAGYKVGGIIYNHLSTGTQNTIGNGLAHTLAFFGNKESQGAIEQNHRYSSGINAVRPRANNVPIVVHTSLEVDGKKMAHSVTYHQTKAANRASGGFNGVDGSMNMMSLIPAGR